MLRTFFIRCEHLPFKDYLKDCCDTCHTLEDWGTFQEDDLFEATFKTFDKEGPIEIIVEHCCFRKNPLFYQEWMDALANFRKNAGLVNT